MTLKDEIRMKLLCIGFEIVGKEFDEANIPQLKIVKQLNSYVKLVICFDFDINYSVYWQECPNNTPQLLAD